MAKSAKKQHNVTCNLAETFTDYINSDASIGIDMYDSYVSVRTSKGTYRLNKHKSLNSYHGILADKIKARVVCKKGYCILTYWA